MSAQTRSRPANNQPRAQVPWLYIISLSNEIGCGCFGGFLRDGWGPAQSWRVITGGEPHGKGVPACARLRLRLIRVSGPLNAPARMWDCPLAECRDHAMSETADPCRCCRRRSRLALAAPAGSADAGPETGLRQSSRTLTVSRVAKVAVLVTASCWAGFVLLLTPCVCAISASGKSSSDPRAHIWWRICGNMIVPTRPLAWPLPRN